MKKNRWLENEDQVLRVNYPKLGAHGCVSLLNNRSVSAIENRAITNLGLKLTKEQRSLVVSLAKKHVNVNADQFINVTTSEAAYILGFLWADGWIYTNNRNYNVSTKISVDDGNNLLPIFNKIGVWNYYIYKTKWKPAMTITTNNKLIYDQLLKLGYAEKSIISPEAVINIIPDDLKHYFILGIVDGDGCFYINQRNGVIKLKQFTISSTYEQDWSYMVNLSNKLKIKYKIVKQKKEKSSYSQFRVTNLDGIIKLGEYIYQSFDIDHIGFTRKFNKFKQIKNYYYGN